VQQGLRQVQSEQKVRLQSTLDAVEASAMPAVAAV
jgi:hypothetical protein